MLIKLSLMHFFSQVVHFSNNLSTLAGQMLVVQRPRFEQNHNSAVPAEHEPQEQLDRI